MNKNGQLRVIETKIWCLERDYMDMMKQLREYRRLLKVLYNEKARIQQGVLEFCDSDSA